jgi:WD40 repeat protein
MSAPRYAHTATRLANGDVLVTGGFTYDRSDCFIVWDSPAVNSAELYDHVHHAFKPTGSMSEDRGGHTATLLGDGRVLIAGGGKEDIGRSWLGEGSVEAEVYYPAAGTFIATGKMTTGRVGHTATRLSNGKVLITGGWASAGPIATAELYDPSTGAFSPTGTMTSPRGSHTATLLHDGKVLITGGASDQTGSGSVTSEIYDPNTGLFAATGNMGVARRWHTATLLPNGKVLVVGGGSRAAELYDPATASFSRSGVTEASRSAHSATLLQNGSVIVVGGFKRGDAIAPLAMAELYH